MKKSIIIIILLVGACISMTQAQTTLADLMDRLASDIEGSQGEFLTGEKLYPDILQEFKEAPDSMFLDIANQEIQRKIDHAAGTIGTLEYDPEDITLGEAQTEYGKILMKEQAEKFESNVIKAWQDYINFRSEYSYEEAKQKAAQKMKETMSAIHGTASEQVMKQWRNKLLNIEPPKKTYLRDARKAFDDGDGNEAMRLGELAYRNNEEGACNFLMNVYDQACKALKGKRKREIKKRKKALNDCSAF